MRKAKPFLAVLVFEYLLDNGSKARKVTTSQIEQFLIKNANISKSIAAQEVANLLEDEIIVASDKKKSGKHHGSQTVRLFIDEEIEHFDQDCYCFECFLPGELLKCLRCTRSFHFSCIRKYPERPNYAVPVTNVISEFEDESDTDISSRDQQRTSPAVESLETSSPIVCTPIRHTEKPTIRECHVVLVDIMRSSVNSLEFKNEIEDKTVVERKLEVPDVICLGEVRPPTRQRVTVSVTPNFLKNESNNLGDDSETNRRLCTSCRLWENGQLTQPPNLKNDEMCHMLNYTFKRCRAWLKRDVYKHLEHMKIPEKSIPLLIKKFFQRRPIMTLDIIRDKLKDIKYKLLVEILMDFVELQFVIGVLLGSDSLEFDCTKYAVRDLTYDIAEIKRCPDCFRHSSDRITPLWFALPCVQRHELVFAKCPGHSYWPAKVVRVLRNAAKYDVRFFGGNHERSLIDSASIRPIDTLNLNFPRLLSFKKAMIELRCYQSLAQYSYTRFSYHASRDDVNEIIVNMMGAIDRSYEKPSKRPKTSKISVRNQTFSENDADSEGYSSTRQNPKNKLKRLPPKLTRLDSSSNRNSPASVISTPSPLSTGITNYTTSTITIEQHIAEMNALREQLYELHQRELVIAKMKPYCVKCLRPAKFLCCIHAWYCSPLCQRQHWHDGHDKQCNNCGTSIDNNG